MKTLCKSDSTISPQYHWKQELGNWFQCCLSRHETNKQSENCSQPNIPWDTGGRKGGRMKLISTEQPPCSSLPVYAVGSRDLSRSEVTSPSARRAAGCTSR